MDTCLESPFTFQQDSAPAHHVYETIGLLQRYTPDLILPGLWPPNSLDLNPVNYIVWGVIAQRVYQSRVKIVDELKERRIAVWSDFRQDILDSAIDQ